MAKEEELKEPLVPAEAADEEDEEFEDADDDAFATSASSSVAAFKLNLQLAMRTAIMCAVTALPVILPSWNKSIDPNYEAQLATGVTQMVVFTVFGNVGMTNQLAYQGVVGTLMACIPVHVCSALMPHGAAGEHYCAPIAHAVNVIFIFLGMWLNINDNVRKFMVCWHIYFFMEFVNPGTTSSFNTSWAIDTEAYTTCMVVTVTIGVLCAIAVMLLPYPVSATRASREAALESVGRLTNLMDQLTVYYNRDEGSVKIHQLEEVANTFRDFVFNMQTDISASWWETFDMGRQGTRRMLLGQFCDLMKEMSDVVFALQVCISNEDFEKTHVNCMQRIQQKVSKLTTAVGDLLRMAALAADDGHVTEEEKEPMAGMVAKVRTAIKDLAVAFDATRRQLSPNQVITAELQSESFYVHGLSVYARRAVDFTEKMMNNPPAPTPLFTALQMAFLEVFDPDHLKAGANLHGFAVRNTISIVMCFYIGFYLGPYSGVPGGTASLLLTSYTGSALHKNMMRLQAVCIGSILPHIIARIVGQSCDPRKLFFQCVAVFIWETLTCFVYYSSTQWAYVGCLTGAFAPLVLIYPCVENLPAAGTDIATEKAFQATAFEKMTNTSIAAVVMTLVDMVLMSQRASTMASEKVIETLVTLDAGLQATFQKRTKSGACKRGTIKTRTTMELTDRAFAGRAARCNPEHRSQNKIQNLLNLSATLGHEANLEPRYHRVPWPEAYFQGLVRYAQILSANLHALDQVFKGTDANYGDIFSGIRGLEAFEKVRDDVLRTSEDCLHLVQAVLQNETGKEMFALVDKMNSLEKVDKIDSMPELMESVNLSGLKYPSMAAASMEDDLICRINVVFMLYDSSIATVAAIVKDTIRQAT